MTWTAPSSLPGQCSEQRFGEIARAWGYGGTVDFDRKPGARPQAPVLAQGRIDASQLPSGIRLCSSDLLGSRDQVRTATLGRSLTVFVMLDGTELRWRHGPGRQPRDGAAQAGVLAVHDHAWMMETQRRDARSRTFVVQAMPGEIHDDVLASQLEQALRHTNGLPMDTARGRGSATAIALAMSHEGGAIAGLLRESAALALLARALIMLQTQPVRDPGQIHPRDHQRMLLVRDKLLAQPEANHSLTSLALEAGVSVTTLKLRFAQVMGCTVFEFLRQQRLDRARHGLLNEGWSVKQAAYYAGFRHPTNFATAFRRKFGTAPSEA